MGAAGLPPAVGATLAVQVAEQVSQKPRGVAGLGEGAVGGRVGWVVLCSSAGRLLRRSAREGDRPALYAAQFALSHACWLIAYPLAGWTGGTFGLTAAFAVLAVLTLASTAAPTSSIMAGRSKADLPCDPSSPTTSLRDDTT